MACMLRYVGLKRTILALRLLLIQYGLSNWWEIISNLKVCMKDIDFLFFVKVSVLFLVK